MTEPPLPKLIISNSLAVAAAAPPGPTTTDRQVCNAGCSRGCSKVKGTSNYACKTCKRGFAREGGNAQTCNFCAQGYGTAITPSLSPSVRRGFVACKREPCNRCTTCPQGTTSRGGARGVYGTTYGNGTVATCVPATPQSFQLTITTNPKFEGGAWVCDPAFASVLKGLIETSLNAQGAIGASATPAGNCVVDANTAAAYTFNINYLGTDALSSGILAASKQDCQQIGENNQTGGICSALPMASGDDNICVAFTKATAGGTPNYILCNGAGMASFTQTVLTTPVTTPLPVRCDPAFAPLLAELVSVSLNNRPSVAGARVTPTSQCTLEKAGNSSFLGQYKTDVFFYGKKTLSNEIISASQTPINSAAFTGGVCDAYPKANAANDNLCKAFSLRVTPGFIITTSVTEGTNSSVVPTATIALGVTTAQTTSDCKPEVANVIADNMRTSLITQTTQPLTDATTVILNNCAVLRVNASMFAIVGNTLYVAYEGKVFQGFVSDELAAKLGPGRLDLQSIGIKTNHRRRLLQEGEQSDLFLVNYNMVANLVGYTAPGQVVDTQAIEAYARSVEKQAMEPDGGFDRAFPLPNGKTISVTITQQVLDNTGGTVGVSALVVEKVYNPQEPVDNPTTTEWAGVKQAMVTTAYNIDPAAACANTDYQQAMIKGVVDSLNAIPDKYLYPTSSFLGCEPVDGNAVFTLMTSFKGTKSDNAALIAAAAAGPFTVCTQAYTKLCPTYAAVTGATGTPQQVVCIQDAMCPSACPAGTWRNGQDVEACDFVLGGYWWDGAVSKSEKCPANTYARSRPARSISAGQAIKESCLVCDTGRSTNGATGSTSCGFVLPGFYYNQDSKAAVPCPPDFYANETRPIATATACTRCGGSTTTFGKTGQSTCLPSDGTVPPGSYWDGEKAVPCPSNTFSPIARDTAQATSCFPCETLVAFVDRNPVTGTVYEMVASGSIIGATSCNCPANTFFAVGSDPAVPSAACVACPQGTTSGGSGAVGVDACALNCKAGYWGDPSRTSVYGQQCRACPIMTPGTGASATPNQAPAPVEQARCTSCSFYSTLMSGSGAPAACTACSGGSGGSGCGQCVAGYYGAGGSCAKCPGGFDTSAAAPLSSKDSGLAACGGCVAGKFGGECQSSCTNAPDIAGGTYVLPLVPTTDPSNCLTGCAVGSGVDPTSGACTACPGGYYSPGTRVAGKHPVCQQCPPGSEPTDGGARCKTFNKAALDATEAGLWDEFD